MTSALSPENMPSSSVLIVCCGTLKLIPGLEDIVDRMQWQSAHIEQNYYASFKELCELNLPLVIFITPEFLNSIWATAEKQKVEGLLVHYRSKLMVHIWSEEIDEKVMKEYSLSLCKKDGWFRRLHFSEISQLCSINKQTEAAQKIYNLVQNVKPIESETFLLDKSSIIGQFCKYYSHAWKVLAEDGLQQDQVERIENSNSHIYLKMFETLCLYKDNERNLSLSALKTIFEKNNVSFQEELCSVLDLAELLEPTELLVKHIEEAAIGIYNESEVESQSLLLMCGCSFGMAVGQIKLHLHNNLDSYEQCYCLCIQNRSLSLGQWQKVLLEIGKPTVTDDQLLKIPDLISNVLQLYDAGEDENKLFAHLIESIAPKVSGKWKRIIRNLFREFNFIKIEDLIIEWSDPNNHSETCFIGCVLDIIGSTPTGFKPFHALYVALFITKQFDLIVDASEYLNECMGDIYGIILYDDALPSNIQKYLAKVCESDSCNFDTCVVQASEIVPTNAKFTYVSGEEMLK